MKSQVLHQMGTHITLFHDIIDMGTHLDEVVYQGAMESGGGGGINLSSSTGGGGRIWVQAL